MSYLLKKLTRFNLFSGSDMKLVHEEGRETDALLMILRIGRAAIVLIARALALIDSNTYWSRTTSMPSHVLEYWLKPVVCSGMQDI